MSRLENTIRNVTVGLGSNLLLLLLQFVNRSVFVSVLGKNYLGTNGLFNDILSMLSVAELGLGTAIVYAMYKPMANGNKTELAKLVNFYRKAYQLIGGLISITGVVLTPFLGYLIQGGGTEVEHLQLIYLLTLANSTVTYFFSYKTTLLTVAQMEYIQSIITTVFNILRIVFQIVFVLLTSNYILYLVIQLLCTLGSNIVASKEAERRFADVLQQREVSLPLDERKTLFKNVRALLLHRLGSFFVNGTDNIIISKFLGLAISGIYSNYTLLLGSVKGFIALIFNALTASVGNLNAVESKEKGLEVFNKINFMGFWIACFCSCCFFSLLNPFIYILCKGDTSYLFDMPIVAVIVLNFYLSQMRNPIHTFKNAMGLYWYDRWKPIAESVINIVISLLLVVKIGFAGVIIGTSISTVSVVLAVEPRIIYHYGYGVSVKPYFVQYFQYFFVTVLCCGITYGLTSRISDWSWIGFAFRTGISVIVPNMILLLLYHHTKEYQYFKTIIWNRVKRK